MSQKLIDEMGNKYGDLTVIGLTKDKNNRTAWVCQCECGNTKIVRGPDLRKGKITSCGCGSYRGKQRLKDLSGQTFGYLKVLSLDKAHYNKKTKKNYYKCLCTACNTICYKCGNLLTTGHVMSCGCKTKELLSRAQIIDETGNRYGKLTVINLENYKGKMRWKCKCDCGNITYVDGTMLRSGNTKSCGCNKWHSSYEANEIEKWLKEQNISYKKEYTFNDLRGNSGLPLRFDFAIFNNDNLLFCIEYNGRQHYEPVEYFGGKEKFLVQQEYDKRKIEYCSKNNIQLIILPYTNSHECNIETILHQYNTFKGVIK